MKNEKTGTAKVNEQDAGAGELWRVCTSQGGFL